MDPFCTIQEGVDAALDGDIVLVAPALYTEDVVIPGRQISLIGHAGNNQAIIESVLGTAPVLDVRAGAQLELVGFTLRQGQGGLNADHALVSIRQCRFQDNFRASEGGGIRAYHSPLTVQECKFEQNDADFGASIAVLFAPAIVESCVFRRESTVFLPEVGAAIYADSSDLIVRGIDASGLRTNQGGAAIFAEDSRVQVEDSLFSDNETHTTGGAVALAECEAHVARCSFADNISTAGQGAGLWIYHQANLPVVVEECTFERNRAWDGGGVYVYSSSTSFLACMFQENVAGTFATNDGYGGAAYLPTPATALFERCIFLANRADGIEALNKAGRGGATYGGASLVNCTLVGNRAKQGVGFAKGGGAYGAAYVLNCIARNNLPDQLASSPIVSWSDVEDGFTGEGNFDADPLFWGPISEDYHLTSGSPCIDAGHPRMQDPDGSRIDVGALSYDASYCGPPGIYCEAKINSQGCVPAIGSSGAPRLSGVDDFHVTASSILNQTWGVLMWSRAGATDKPFQGGTLCLLPPHLPVALLDSGGNPPPADCSGTFDFYLSHALMQRAGFAAGDRIYLQFWYQDDLQTDGTSSGLTDALEVTICPGLGG